MMLDMGNWSTRGHVAGISNQRYVQSCSEARFQMRASSPRAVCMTMGRAKPS